MVIEIENSEEAGTLEEIAEDIATCIVKGGVQINTLKTLLIEFANEIKRQSIEP